MGSIFLGSLECPLPLPVSLSWGHREGPCRLTWWKREVVFALSPVSGDFNWKKNPLSFRLRSSKPKSVLLSWSVFKRSDFSVNHLKVWVHSLPILFSVLILTNKSRQSEFPPDDQSFCALRMRVGCMWIEQKALGTIYAGRSLFWVPSIWGNGRTAKHLLNSVVKISVNQLNPNAFAQKYFPPKAQLPLLRSWLQSNFLANMLKNCTQVSHF